MARNIFIVEAWIVDANGTFNVLSGYPKKFDSNSYDGDIQKTMFRAEGDMAEVWGAFCKRDDRKVQTVMLTDLYGQQYAWKSRGQLDEPEPQPTEEPSGEQE